MHSKLSKTMKKAIIFSVILTFMAMAIHGYNLHRTLETHKMITEVMQEKQVIRDTAIRILEKEGHVLYKDFSSAIFSMCICVASLIVIYLYSQNNGFFLGFFAAFFAVFSTYFGGMLLFYIFLSGKSEKTSTTVESTDESEWQSYLHNRSVLT